MPKILVLKLQHNCFILSLDRFQNNHINTMATIRLVNKSLRFLYSSFILRVYPNKDIFKILFLRSVISVCHHLDSFHFHLFFKLAAPYCYLCCSFFVVVITNHTIVKFLYSFQENFWYSFLKVGLLRQMILYAYVLNNFARYCQNLFYKCCIILHSLQQ